MEVIQTKVDGLIYLCIPLFNENGIQYHLTFSKVKEKFYVSSYPDDQLFKKATKADTAYFKKHLEKNFLIF